MTTAAPDPEATMTQIREGMQVVDDSGAKVGVVAELKMGDPSAITPAGQRSHDMGFGTFEQRVPEHLAARLLRTGYIKIKRGGIFRRDAYAGADEIADVRDDVVTLAVGGDRLER
jgi:hypothetical protein